jgi:hypothetical protein
MTKEIDILKDHVPSPQEVAEYEQKWNTLADYVNQENALNKLFFNLCPENKDMSDILIKCSSLNDFYSTNIFKVHNVAKHFLNQKIDERLAVGDLNLVMDLANIEINGKRFFFYSFATKYCSHHRPDIYPIYDSYVNKLLKYFRNRDGFMVFKEANLKEYSSYYNIIQSFRSFYGLQEFSVKQIDKYLWQLGKKAYNRYK